MFHWPRISKTRRTGLIVFGILKITLGALAALMIPLMLLGEAMAARANLDGMAVRQLTTLKRLIPFKTYFAEDKQFLSAE